MIVDHVVVDDFADKKYSFFVSKPFLEFCPLGVILENPALKSLAH